MKRIVGISGSLRKNSYNTALLLAAKELMPFGVTLQILSIEGIPPFNEDLEKPVAPSVVNFLKDQIATSEGLLISTPEYNAGIPGVLKNAFDWISRPGTDLPRVLHRKPIALMGATPGGFGTLNAQTAWLPVIRFFKMRPCLENGIYPSAAHQKFDASLKLTDEPTSKALKKFLADFVAFSEQQKVADVTGAL